MARRDNLHSRVVAWMKIILPLAALGILSTLFLISNTFDPNEALPMVDIDLQQRAQDQGATNATFAGVTQAGHQVTVQTVRSRPSPEDSRLFLAEDVTAAFLLNSGNSVNVTSDRGEMNQHRNSASLSGNVHIDTSTGYVLTTELLTANFDELYAESPGPVEGTAPAGDLTAGRMVLRNNAETDQAHLLFTNGVKLIYQPQISEE
ncbi:LPS export ABC transporter periplasmic protein LptC [Roseovarius indicus]|nr:LPS export ABC transporter periplasmic protein LptC [Roseovarius indicus]